MRSLKEPVSEPQGASRLNRKIDEMILECRVIEVDEKTTKKWMNRNYAGEKAAEHKNDLVAAATEGNEDDKEADDDAGDEEDENEALREDDDYSAMKLLNHYHCRLERRILSRVSSIPNCSQSH